MTALPARERHHLIDALRGGALAGVFLVNLVSLSLYEFLGDDARAALWRALTCGRRPPYRQRAARAGALAADSA